MLGRLRSSASRLVHCCVTRQLSSTAHAAPTAPAGLLQSAAAPTATSTARGATKVAAASSTHLVTMSTAAAEPEVLSEVQGHVAIATLNRPRALNALNTSMVESMYELYSQWEADPGVACILLKGAGGKAFCAGGDVKTVVQQGLAGEFDKAVRFFRSEYRLNYLISRLATPHVALIDGITMGGGVGVSVHGTFRVATERTVFSMPECAIGLYPDVGGSYFLPRLQGGLGMYLALTGARLTGVDVRHAGIATHYIPSRHLPAVEQAIAGLGPAARDAGKLRELLASFEGREALPEGSLEAMRADINFCFGGKQSVEEVYSECERSGGQWGIDAIAQMSKGSPTSQKVSFEQLRRGASMDLGDCLRMENRMVHRCVMNAASDFYEGVQAALIRRSGAPRWDPASLKDVRPEHVEAFFRPLPPESELQLPLLPRQAQQSRL
ncbi:hypothetical protein ABPG77_000444 [Micractinium sp. CCAP 211/92]